MSFPCSATKPRGFRRDSQRASFTPGTRLIEAGSSSSGRAGESRSLSTEGPAGECESSSWRAESDVATLRRETFAAAACNAITQKKVTTHFSQKVMCKNTFFLRPLFTQFLCPRLRHDTNLVVTFVPSSPTSQTIPEPILPNNLDICFLPRIELLRILQFVRGFAYFLDLFFSTGIFVTGLRRGTTRRIKTNEVSDSDWSLDVLHVCSSVLDKELVDFGSFLHVFEACDGDGYVKENGKLVTSYRLVCVNIGEQKFGCGSNGLNVPLGGQRHRLVARSYGTRLSMRVS